MSLNVPLQLARLRLHTASEELTDEHTLTALVDNSVLQNVDHIRDEFQETWLWVDENTGYIINSLSL